jgi:hypothetical protein
MVEKVKKRKRISEAPESDAGDDFHVLWTMKKSFDLLNFDEDGLKAITIEGIDQNTANKLDPSGSKLLGVDIAEYFGGDSLISAKRVVVTQLKYSTRRITENWTISKLYYGKKKGSFDGSIIHRLAQIFKTFLDEYGRELVLTKLTLKLVSNRNFNPGQKLLICTIQKFLKKKKSKTFSNSIFRKFSEKQSELKKLKTATRLNSVEFIDFISLLDFEDCGTSSRYNQEIEIISAIKNVGINNIMSNNNSLFRMIWRKMLPEAIDTGENVITDLDLLNCFGMSLERLSPVSQKFEEIENLVERNQIRDIVDKIINNKSGLPICLHGGAGIGKSIIAQLIKKKIPKDSEVILYDCYGEGEYLNPSDCRHLHKEAIMQISNEMAKRIGSPFLLSKENDSYILIREFKRRIELALKILKTRNPDSVLVLVVDAADNSVIAAQKNQTVSFIQDLVNESYPVSFSLVVTSRSHRLITLNLPEDYIDILLTPFDYQETKSNLSFYFPEISVKEIQEFHKLTSGIPRVQTYALDLKREGINEVINYLKPNGKNVEDLIQEKIIEAGKKIGGNGEKILNTFFSTLISLPRPVPITYISRVSGISEALLQDLSIDIWNGLVLSNSHLSFRDEDFETYIRQMYKPEDEIYKRIADLFLEKSDEDEYASINLGIALFDANYSNKLKSIVLNEDYRTLPIDPIRKKEVFIKRTKLAMKVCSQTDDNLTFFQLAFIAADAAKTDVALNNMIITNADLLSSFGETESFQMVNIQSEEQPWVGSFHYQLAAINSRNISSTEIAKQHFKTAEKWIRWRQTQKQTDEFQNFRITDEDIAYGAEACLRIYGSQSAYNWLKRWHPKIALFRATSHLLSNIMKYSNKDQIIEWLKPLRLPLYAKLVVLEKLKFLGIHFSGFNGIADTLIRVIDRKIRFEKYLLPLVISFCESSNDSKPFNKDQILKILGTIKGELPAYVPTLMDSSHYDKDEKLNIDLFLKKESLKAFLTGGSLKLIDLYPEKYKKIESESNYKTQMYINEEKRKFDTFYKHAISIYQFRIEVFFNRTDNQMISKFHSICKSIKDDWELRYYDSHWAPYKLNFLALVLIDTISYFKVKDKLIHTIICSFEIKKQNSIPLRLAVAEKISTIVGLKPCTLELLYEIDTLIQDSNLPSSEMVNYYIQSSKIAGTIDNKVSKFYFDKAVEAVSEIDIEAQEQIKCISELTQLEIPYDNPHLAFEFSRFVEYCKSRLDGYDHFPLIEGLKGVARLDCPTAFTTICRWSHRYVSNLTELILPVLTISINKEFITSNIGSSMLPINIYYWKSYVEFIKTLIGKYDLLEDSLQKNIFVKSVIRDVQINCNSHEKFETIKSIYEEIKNGKFLDNTLVLNLENYLQFMTSLHDNKSHENISNPTTKKEVLVIEERHNLKVTNIDIVSTSSINEELKRISSNSDSFFSRPMITELLKEIKTICAPENYVPHLNAFININPELISFYTFEEAIKERLEEWSINPLVRQWKKQNFKQVLKLWFHNFKWSDGISYDGIEKFAEIFSIDHSELSNIILSILPEKIEELSATALYQTISFLKNRLNKNENEQLISWVIPRWNTKIKSDFADGPWDEKQTPSRTYNEVIAQTLRFILGHPDNRVKWRGVHVLRRLIESGDSKVLLSLIKSQNNSNCLPFQHKEFPFFWISAKLYLWIAIARISKENPKELLKFKKEIIHELHNQELPHVLIMFYIKQTCLNLNENANSFISSKEKKAIDNLLVSGLKPVREGRLQRKQRKYNSLNGKWKFKFDSMDTLPYWYNGLARCFNLSEYDVADLADKYISEKWGYVGDIHQDEFVKVPSDRDYYLTRNDHGSLPTIENLRMYYEYHSMYCAASELLEKEPPLEADPNEWGSWEYWLKSEGLTWPNIWLSDLRDPIPLDKRFWISDYKEFDAKWRDIIEEKYYDEVLGLSNEIEIKDIIAYGDYTRYFGENYESVSIDSAIVSTRTSESLLRALQTSADNHDFRIPLEGDDLQINESIFQLSGWLREVRSEVEGLDKNDPFAGNVNKSYILFGKEVDNLFVLDYSTDFKLAFHNGEMVSTFMNWNNTTEHKSYDDFQTDGYYLIVNVSFLLEFLKKINMCMIFKCSISRQLKEREYNHKYFERKNDSKLYLIDQNGKVKTIRGRDYKIG